VRRGTSKSQLHQLGQGGNALGDGASDCVHRNLEEVGRVQLLARRDRSNVWANTATSLLLLLLLLVVVVVVLLALLLLLLLMLLNLLLLLLLLVVLLLVLLQQLRCRRASRASRGNAAKDCRANGRWRCVHDGHWVHLWGSARQRMLLHHATATVLRTGSMWHQRRRRSRWHGLRRLHGGKVWRHGLTNLGQLQPIVLRTGVVGHLVLLLLGERQEFHVAAAFRTLGNDGRVLFDPVATCVRPRRELHVTQGVAAAVLEAVVL